MYNISTAIHIFDIYMCNSYRAVD